MQMPKEAADLFGYRVVLSHLSEDYGGGWLAEVPELDGCISTGESPQQALANVQDAVKCWLESARKHGRQIPPPVDHQEPEFSGKFTLRVPRTLHRMLSRQAESEGVSLNQYIVSLIAFGAGRESAQHDAQARARAAAAVNALVSYARLQRVKALLDEQQQNSGAFGFADDDQGPIRWMRAGSPIWKLSSPGGFTHKRF